MGNSTKEFEIQKTWGQGSCRCLLFKPAAVQRHFSFLFTDWSCKELQSLLKSQRTV